MITLAELLSPVRRANTLQGILDRLDAVGFNASSWQEGSIQLDLVESAAVAWADLSAAVRVMAAGAFSSLASGALLTQHAKSFYGNLRLEAVKTKGPLRLTTAAGAGPHTIAVGQLVVSDIANGYTYRNVTGGTLTGGTNNDSIEFEAEVAGASRNVGVGTITKLNTPLAGVTVSNPVLTGSTWYTRAGADEESDTKLHTRNVTKWALFALGRPSEAYTNMALQVAGITRVYVDDTNARDAGFVDVYCAGPTATAAGADVTAAQAIFDAYEAASATTTAFAAPEKVLNVTATVYVTAAKNTAAKQAAILKALQDYVNGLPLGGIKLPPSTTGVVPRSELEGAMTALTDVVAVAMTSPNADVPMALNEVAKEGTFNLVFQSA
ncbi:MAG: hypothetical protein AMXMBFR56_76960 [Polyangiaceae bacterium]